MTALGLPIEQPTVAVVDTDVKFRGDSGMAYGTPLLVARLHIDNGLAHSALCPA